MAIRLKQSTDSQEIPLGPFLDSTDGNTQETGLTIANTDIKLWKNGATTLANKNSGGATHIAGGVYYCTLDSTDTNTLGPLVVFVHVAGALAVRVECEVLAANVYNSLIANAARLEVDVREISGVEQVAEILEELCSYSGVLDGVSLKIAAAVAASGLFYGAVIPVASLDTFPVDGGPPPPGGNWTAIPTLTALEVNGGKLISGGVGTPRGCYWSAETFENDVAAYIQVSSVSSTLNDFFILMIGYDPATGNGYGLRVSLSAGDNDFSLVRSDAGALTVVGNYGYYVPNGDMWVAIRRQGEMLSAYVTLGERGGWVLVAAAHDNTYTSGGRLAVMILNTEWELDNFGGCNVNAVDEIIADKIGDDAITSSKIATGAIDDDVLAAELDVYTAKVWLQVDDNAGYDRYTAAWFKNGAPVTSGITLPTIQVVDRADGSDLIAEDDMIEIGATQRFKYDEDTDRIAAGGGYLVIVGATIDGAARTWQEIVGRDA